MSDLALVLACAAKMLVNFSPVLALWAVCVAALEKAEAPAATEASQERNH